MTETEFTCWSCRDAVAGAELSEAVTCSRCSDVVCGKCAEDEMTKGEYPLCSICNIVVKAGMDNSGRYE